MNGAVLTLTWVGGILGGVLIAGGMVSAVTGRMLINPRRWNWSAGEARTWGMANVATGVLLAIDSLAAGLVLMNGPGPNWVEPGWWIPVSPTIGLIIMINPISMLLLEQHHQGHWPFSRSDRVSD